MGDGFAELLAEHGAWEYELSAQTAWWSQGLYRIHGVSPREFRPGVASVRELIHPDDLERYAEAVRTATEARSPFSVQHRIVRPDGVERTLIVRGAYLPSNNGRPARLVGTTQDVTGRTGEEEELWHLANHDALTSLFNRRRFMEELQREVAMAGRTGAEGAVVVLDLDGFKDINDSLGHPVGDRLLVRISGHLRHRLRSTDTLARLGGDEFAIVLPQCSAEDARQIAVELLQALASGPSVRIAGRERTGLASAGIAPFGTDHTAEQLLVEADLAMYRAKGNGGNRVEVFGEEMRAELAERIEVEAELREAVSEGQLWVAYQPIVSLADGTAVGCEALVRWNHPSRGVVAPADFVAVAEEYGLISEIGDWVLGEACAQASEWRRQGAHLFVSVNVSPLQLVRYEIVESVRAALAESGLPAPLLCLEMTETSLTGEAEDVGAVLRELKQLGVRIAIDDFGGGASALSYLSLLPIDVIKVDRLFVDGLTHRPNDRAIVAAVISLAEELELSVIAEGVETEGQHRELRELRCDQAQGFLYSPPRPAKELDLRGFSAAVQPGVGDPSVIREFMRQIGIPARVGADS